MSIYGIAGSGLWDTVRIYSVKRRLSWILNEERRKRKKLMCFYIIIQKFKGLNSVNKEN
jgi:hypothetical protein